MTRSCSLTAAILCAILGLWPGVRPATAQGARIEDRATFDIEIRGLRGAFFQMTAAQEGAAYVAAAEVKSVGLASVFKRFSYTGRVEGTQSRGRYRPSGYSETADTGKKRMQRRIVYTGGRPVGVTTVPEREPKPYDVTPETVPAGAVDPVTALYATLRDVDAGQECTTDVVFFDGTETARIRLSGRKADGSGVTCAGVYRRLAGYSDKDMKERTDFPFMLTYAPVEGGRMRVMALTLDTLFGKGRMVRR